MNNPIPATQTELNQLRYEITELKSSIRSIVDVRLKNEMHVMHRAVGGILGDLSKRIDATAAKLQGDVDAGIELATDATLGEVTRLREALSDARHALDDTVAAQRKELEARMDATVLEVRRDADRALLIAKDAAMDAVAHLRGLCFAFARSGD